MFLNKWVVGKCQARAGDHTENLDSIPIWAFGHKRVETSNIGGLSVRPRGRQEEGAAADML